MYKPSPSISTIIPKIPFIFTTIAPAQNSFATPQVSDPFTKVGGIGLR